MSKAVMLSIHPYYGYNIAIGKKKVEIRKRVPNIPAPFKVYLYCTSVKKMPLVEYVTAHAKTGGAIDGWQGHVFAEFTCDNIQEFAGSIDGIESKWHSAHLDKSCLTPDQIEKYITSFSNGYAWSITNVKVYDQPLKVSDFAMYGCTDKLHHPPQSFCYVNEREIP